MADTFQIVMTMLSSLGAAASAWAALQAVKISKDTAAEGMESNRIAEQTRLAVIRPHVVIYTRADIENKSINTVKLIIHNVGPGAARSVNISIIKGGELKMRGGDSITEWGPISRGISVLAPQEKFETNFTSALDPKWVEISQTDFLAEVQYSDIEGNIYKSERIKIDLLGQQHTAMTMERSNDPEIVRNKHLQKIGEQLQQLQTSKRGA